MTTSECSALQQGGDEMTHDFLQVPCQAYGVIALPSMRSATVLRRYTVCKLLSPQLSAERKSVGRMRVTYLFTTLVRCFLRLLRMMLVRYTIQCICTHICIVQRHYSWKWTTNFKYGNLFCSSSVTILATTKFSVTCETFSTLRKV